MNYLEKHYVSISKLTLNREVHDIDAIAKFDFSFQPSINAQQMKDFKSLRFIENQENIVFLGSSGVGMQSSFFN